MICSLVELDVSLGSERLKVIHCRLVICADALLIAAGLESCYGDRRMIFSLVDPVKAAEVCALRRELLIEYLYVSIVLLDRGDVVWAADHVDAVCVAVDHVIMLFVRVQQLDRSQQLVSRPGCYPDTVIGEQKLILDEVIIGLVCRYRFPAGFPCPGVVRKAEPGDGHAVKTIDD